MHFYILDPTNLPAERFEQLQVQLSGLLAEFNIAGEMVRVAPLRRIPDLVDLASQRGVRTLVACGNDDTFNMVLANLKGRDFTLAYIPFDPDSALARILGTKDVTTAVKSLAARRIENIDLARIDKTFFISYLEFGVLSRNIKSINLWNVFKLVSEPKISLSARVDDSYTINLECMGGLVINSRSSSSSKESVANPTDKHLDFLILENLSKMFLFQHKESIISGRLEEIPGTTVIKCKKLEFLKPAGQALTMLGRVISKFPATVEIQQRSLKIVVGKDRTF
ncbi:MAG TPA: diacylglycerol kinase family protein [Patescibacteria group bacterium]|nr:diacylglycerol kinase family protein [Patescibacteria group bacterium]